MKTGPRARGRADGLVPRERRFLCGASLSLSSRVHRVPSTMFSRLTKHELRAHDGFYFGTGREMRDRRAVEGADRDSDAFYTLVTFPVNKFLRPGGVPRAGKESCVGTARSPNTIVDSTDKCVFSRHDGATRAHGSR